MQRFFLLLCLSLVAACAKPHPLDALEPGEHGRVVRIIDGDALVLDTGHFDAGFNDRLLASFDDLDGMIDGLLVHSENWQALNLFGEKYPLIFKANR